MNETFDNITYYDEYEGVWPMHDYWPWRVGLFALGGAVIIWIGIICNIISIIVLTHFRTHSSAPFLLICLAVFDSVYLLSIFVLEVLSSMENGEIFVGYHQRLFPIYGVIYPLPYLAQTCIIYLVVTITVERYAVVSCPFLAHRICSLKSAGIAVAAVVVFGSLYHIPTYMVARCDEICTNWTQNCTKWIVRTEFGTSTFYNEIYIVWLNLIVNFALPFIILLVLNTLTIRTLRQSRGSVGVHQTLGPEERRLTMMVITMTLIFFICELMAVLSLIVFRGKSLYRQASYAANRFAALADTCLLINSAINFAIYCVTGRKFREVFARIFFRCKKAPLPSAARLKSKEEHTRSRLTSSSSRSSVQTRSTTETSFSSLKSSANGSSRCGPEAEETYKENTVREIDNEL